MDFRDPENYVLIVVIAVILLFVGPISNWWKEQQEKKEKELQAAEKRRREEEERREQQRIQLELERKEQEKQEALAAWEVVRNPSPGIIGLKKKREREEEQENPHVWTDLDYDVILYNYEDGIFKEYYIGEIEVCESKRINYRHGEFVPTTYRIAKNIHKYVSFEEMHPVFPKWEECVAQVFPLGQDFPRSEIMYDEMEAQANRKRDERIRQSSNSQRVVINRPKCPLCGSTNIGPIGAVERGLSVGFLGVASPTIGKSYECRSCHYRW